MINKRPELTYLLVKTTNGFPQRYEKFIYIHMNLINMIKVSRHLFKMIETAEEN